MALSLEYCDERRQKYAAQRDTVGFNFNEQKLNDMNAGCAYRRALESTGVDAVQARWALDFIELEQKNLFKF